MKSLPTRRLPKRPDLDQLKRQAKELLNAFTVAEPGAVAEVKLFYREADPAKFALHQAQLVLARSYGFDSWARLKAYIDGVTLGRLIRTVRSGERDAVRSILRVRPELVNRAAPESGGYTALHYAVLGQSAEMVRVLMQFGADAHVTSAGIYALRNAATPYTIATERGYEEIAAIIREEEKRRSDGKPVATDVPTEFRRLVESGDEDAVIDLLSSHADLIQLQLSHERWSLLHIASALLLPRMAAWLLDHGANINERAADGSAPLDVVGLRRSPGDPSHERLAMVQLLRNRGAAITASAAVILGDEAALRQIASREDIVATRDDRGWLLRLAVDWDRPEILKLLLDLGLDPDARIPIEEDDGIVFSWGMPLYQCARYGKHAMAEMLLEKGADANGQVYAGGTPLSEAYGQRDEAMVAMLERYGGKTNASMAGLYRRVDIARRLLEQFGDAELPDDGFSSGPVAKQLAGAAARGGDPEILRMALERIDIPAGDPRWTALLEAPLGFWNHWVGPWCHPEWDRTTYLACFRMILKKSGPPNFRLRGGTTILHQIVVMGDHVMPEERIAFAVAALDAGARMDRRDDLLLSTPLGWSCRWGREEMVRLFLERGADPVEAGAEPWATPRGWAEKKGHDSIVALLNASTGSSTT